MLIDIITLFPELFYGALASSILRQVADNQVVEVNPVNPREFCSDKHRSVDDSPYSGGPGMIIKPEPLARAIESVSLKKSDSKPEGYKERIIFLSPHGKVFNSQKAEELASYSKLILICGHYEGIDDRIRQMYVDEEISVGDYVLTGGELPALVLIDAVIRFIPGALGNPDSSHEESFSGGLLEHRQYTKPAKFRGASVPDVLLSGNHKKIEEWKLRDSLKETLINRPELLENIKLPKEAGKMLDELKKEKNREQK